MLKTRVKLEGFLHWMMYEWTVENEGGKKLIKTSFFRGFFFWTWPYPLHPLSHLAAGPVVSWVLFFLCFPDAKLFIAGSLCATSPPDFSNSRVPSRGCLTLSSHLRLPHKGYQGRAAAFGPETAWCYGIPLDFSWSTTINMSHLNSGLFWVSYIWTSVSD